MGSLVGRVAQTFLQVETIRNIIAIEQDRYLCPLKSRRRDTQTDARMISNTIF